MRADYLAAASQTDETARRDGAVCAAPSCWSDAESVRIGDRVAKLCETHRKAFLGVSS